MSKKQYLIRITLTAVLSAVAMMINRFASFNVWNLSIGVMFIPVMICAMLLGPVWGGVCYALADLVGALLFPFGPYFPGFTAVAFVSGLLYGLLIGKNPLKTPRFVLRAGIIILIEQVVCTLLLNTLWISLLYGSPFLPTLLARLPKAAFMLALETIVAVVIKLYVVKPVAKVLQK